MLLSLARALYCFGANCSALSFSACKFASLWLSFCVKARAFVTVLVTPAFWTYLPSLFSEGNMFGCTYTNPEVKVCRCPETEYSTVKRPLALPSLRTTTENIQKAAVGKLEVWLALGFCQCPCKPTVGTNGSRRLHGGRHQIQTQKQTHRLHTSHSCVHAVFMISHFFAPSGVFDAFGVVWTAIRHSCPVWLFRTKTSEHSRKGKTLTEVRTQQKCSHDKKTPDAATLEIPFMCLCNFHRNFKALWEC